MECCLKGFIERILDLSRLSSGINEFFDYFIFVPFRHVISQKAFVIANLSAPSHHAPVLLPLVARSLSFILSCFPLRVFSVVLALEEEALTPLMTFQGSSRCGSESHLDIGVSSLSGCRFALVDEVLLYGWAQWRATGTNVSSLGFLG